MSSNKDSFPLNFTYDSICRPYTFSLKKGIYFFQLWGASGGVAENIRTKPLGGYIAGKLSLGSTESFQILIGEKGQIYPKANRNTCGGGGKGGKSYSSNYQHGSSGGGATRLTFSDGQQIAVAAGAGAYCGYQWSSGSFSLPHAGGVSAPDYGYASCGKYNGANQNFGTEDGIGQDGANGIDAGIGLSAEGNGGGGGGYRGGYSLPRKKTRERQNSFGSGGSSYISGHKDCVNHSKVKFFDTVVQPGNEKFIQPNGITMQGHYGDGFMRITFLDSNESFDYIKVRIKIKHHILSCHLMMTFDSF